MKAFLIDPYEQKIDEVSYSGDYKDIYKLIDCQTFDCVGFRDFDDTIYIDDEGLYKDNREFFIIKGYPQPLCGKALVLGYDVDGDSTDPKVSLEKLKSMVAFIPSYFVMGIS